MAASTAGSRRAAASSAGSARPAGSPVGSARSALTALLWSYGGAVVTVVLQLGYTAYTARTVAQDAFGAYAIALTLVQLLGYFATAGLATCLLRVAELTRSTMRAAMRVSAVSGAVCFAVAQCAAPWCAALWHMPELVPMLRLLGCQFLVQPAACAAVAGLRRGGRPRGAVSAELVGHVGGAVVGVVLLARGISPLGLAAAQPTAAALTLALGAAGTAWLPLPEGDAVKARSLLGLSGFLTGFALVRFTVNSAPLWVAGRLLGPGAAGSYSRAGVLCDVPLNFLVKGLNQAAVPVLAERRAQSRPVGRPAEHILCAASAAAFIGFGAAAGAGPAALTLLLGPGWDTAAALVPLLCAAAALQLVYSAGCSIDLARDATRPLIGTQLVVLTTTAVWITVAAARHSLLLLAGAAVAGAAAGHIAQLLRWHHLGLLSGVAVARAHLIHAAVGVTLGIAAALGAAGRSPAGALVCGCLATVPVVLGCVLVRARLPLYAAADDLGLLRRGGRWRGGTAASTGAAGTAESTASAGPTASARPTVSATSAASATSATSATPAASAAPASSANSAT